MKFSLTVLATVALSVSAMPLKGQQANAHAVTGAASKGVSASQPATGSGNSVIDGLVATFQSPEEVAAKATDKRHTGASGKSSAFLPPDNPNGADKRSNPCGGSFSAPQSSGNRDSSLLPPGNPNVADKRSNPCSGFSAASQSAGNRDSSLLPPGNPNGAD
jgi:hypothetical protein